MSIRAISSDPSKDVFILLLTFTSSNFLIFLSPWRPPVGCDLGLCLRYGCGGERVVGGGPRALLMRWVQVVYDPDERR